MGAIDELSRIPRVGLGTWQINDHDECVDTVLSALEMGYRHLDTAQLYGNEEAVGEGIRRSSVERDEVFLATKVSFKNLAPDRVRSSTLESLDRLGFEQVDLLYIHWPAGTYDPAHTLPAFEELRRENRIRYFGVSNFTTRLVEEAGEVLSSPPPVNQVELHPYLQQPIIRKQAEDLGQAVVAYSPFRHGTIFDDLVLNEIAGETGFTPAQVVLSWLLELDRVFPIPKATGETHLQENFNAMDLELTDRHRAMIDDLNRGDRYVDPPFAPIWDKGKE